jgi:hypothetical protein
MRHDESCRGPSEVPKRRVETYLGGMTEGSTTSATRDKGMQNRVRVGLIGLAWVFLLVMLATTFVHIAGGDRFDLNAGEVANVSAPSDPLAELGVAPGNPQQTEPSESARGKAPPANR